MEGKSQVRVHGMWASTYSKRVELALKLKGIPYEYVEEDLRNKSGALLEYNPVHKKIPVLVHNGKPLAESLVILEYIDETWPNHTPRLLPTDQYERAKVRFWASFLQIQMLESAVKVFTNTGEAQDKALHELHDRLTLIEQEMTELIPKDMSSINQENVGLLDIQLVTVFGAYKTQEEGIGKKLIDPEKHPLIFSRLNALNKLPAVIENTPPHDKLLAILQVFINKANQSASFKLGMYFSVK